MITDKLNFSWLIDGEVAKANDTLREALEKTEGDQAASITELRRCILGNAHGLRYYRLVAGHNGELNGLGAMESNVDKLIATRMKKRGMSWTKTGANRMARLISLKEQGHLHSWANHRERQHRRRQELSPPLPEGITARQDRCAAGSGPSGCQDHIPTAPGLRR